MNPVLLEEGKLPNLREPSWVYDYNQTVVCPVTQRFGQIPAGGASLSCVQSVQRRPARGDAAAKAPQVIGALAFLMNVVLCGAEASID